MTVCVAAISSDGECIVCVADKALSYGDYIQWDSDCTKISDLRGQAVAMFSSDKESHITRLVRSLWEIGNFQSHRYELIKSIEEKYRNAYEEMQIAEILTPQMLSKDTYLDAIASGTINEHLHDVARKMQKFELGCDALICGYDEAGEQYILHVGSPGVVTDYTGIGFHAIGSGAEKAVAQLLFAEHRRTYDTARTLYECFDAKAHAEMAVGVGYEWDACFVKSDGPHPVSKEAKSLIDSVWAKANWSPFKTEPELDDMDLPPENWRQELIDHVTQCLQSQKRIVSVIRTPTMSIRDEISPDDRAEQVRKPPAVHRD
jgi:20S proteasome alpha/beta subunit